MILGAIGSPGQIPSAGTTQEVFAGRPVTEINPVQRRQAQPTDDVNQRVQQLNAGLQSGQVSKPSGTGLMVDYFA